jgi:hypothetical protein
MLENSADSRTKNREFPIRTPVVLPALLQIDAHAMFSLFFLR